MQNALNECQADIVKQLDQFKELIQSDIRVSQENVMKSIDCKADALDIQEQLDAKVDLKNVEENCAERSHVEQLAQTVDQLLESVD